MVVSNFNKINVQYYNKALQMKTLTEIAFFLHANLKRVVIYIYTYIYIHIYIYIYIYSPIWGCSRMGKGLKGLQLYLT